MLKHALAALAGLLTLAACGGSSPRPLSYGAAATPTAEEQAAGDQAAAAFQAGRGFSTSADPTLSSPGLADQLASTMGGQPLPSSSGGVASAPTVAALLASLPAEVPVQARLAFLTGLAPAGTAVVVSPFDDPACASVTATAVAGTATWAGCTIHDVQTDPGTGEVLSTAVVHVDGRLDWDAATGTTSWNVSETMAIEMPLGDVTMTIRVSVALHGALTNKDGKVKGTSGSTVSSTASLPGASATGGATTSMSVDLSYTGDPLCITTGTLSVEQRFSGAAKDGNPDQGWRLVWTGDGLACGTLSVSHGQ